METLNLSKIAELFSDKKHLQRYTIDIVCSGVLYVYKIECGNMKLEINQANEIFFIFVECGIIKDYLEFKDGGDLNGEVCSVIKKCLGL